MPTLFYGHVKNGTHRMHYYRTGGQKPPVIFIHGLSDSGLCWSRIAIALELDYDIIMVDLRGHGLSGVGTGMPATEASALDIAELIDSNELGKVVLVGHSIGANVAAETATRYPDKVCGLLLEDPPWFNNDLSDGDQDYGNVLAFWNKRYLRWKSSSFDELIQIIREEHPGWDEDDQFQWAKAKQQLRPEFTNYLGTTPFQWRSVVETLKTRTLFVAGDPAKGGLLKTETQEVIKHKWNNARIVSIPGVGHNIHRDDHVKFIDEARKFLGVFKIKNGLFR